MFSLFGTSPEKLVAQLSLGASGGETIKGKLCSVGKKAVPALISAVENADGKQTPLTRIEAADVLGRIKDDQSVPPLIRILQSGDEEGKAAAAYALGKIGDKRAIDGLIAALKEQNQGVRTRAGFALAEIRDPRGIAVLSSVLHKNTTAVYFDDKNDFRSSVDFKYALNALKSIGGGTALEALSGTLDACWPYQRKQIEDVIAALKKASL